MAALNISATSLAGLMLRARIDDGRAAAAFIRPSWTRRRPLPLDGDWVRDDGGVFSSTSVGCAKKVELIEGTFSGELTGGDVERGDVTGVAKSLLNDGGEKALREVSSVGRGGVDAPTSSVLSLDSGIELILSEE